MKKTRTIKLRSFIAKEEEKSKEVEKASSGCSIESKADRVKCEPKYIPYIEFMKRRYTEALADVIYSKSTERYAFKYTNKDNIHYLNIIERFIIRTDSFIENYKKKLSVESAVAILNDVIVSSGEFQHCILPEEWLKDEKTGGYTTTINSTWFNDVYVYYVSIYEAGSSKNIDCSATSKNGSIGIVCYDDKPNGPVVFKSCKEIPNVNDRNINIMLNPGKIPSPEYISLIYKYKNLDLGGNRDMYLYVDNRVHNTICLALDEKGLV